MIEPDSFYAYAKGKLVLWIPKESKLDLHAEVQMLESSGVRTSAIANPAHAPYGKAAVAALQGEHIYEKVQVKLVLGESASQAASFVTSGAADAGIVALSLAVSPNMKDKGRLCRNSGNGVPRNRAGLRDCAILKEQRCRPAVSALHAEQSSPRPVAPIRIRRGGKLDGGSCVHSAPSRLLARRLCIVPTTARSSMAISPREAGSGASTKSLH